ncbi:TPA: HD domain-containing protein [Candidatus Ventrenecus avicola]|nr:HD domain-containing protein [Candidatus Ventrenecus avicola]
MENKIQNIMQFYTMCVKLKNTIRTGPLVWNIKRERVESVAEHIYGTQMLAIAIYYQFSYSLDLKRIIFMLAIHELEEILIGDYAFYQISREEKLIQGKDAVEHILKDFVDKEEIVNLLDEFNERVTKEAKFAHRCDKLECDLQIKLYEQEGCFDLMHQENNPLINDFYVKGLLESEKSLANAWIEFDRKEYEEDPNFLVIIDYLKKHEI